ncbi:MAG: PAS domain-containing sensor histidine kinase [Alphaproteobacteria bacterium]|nr:PAS domain-containing sensor histidine kinase [Alphaproteobacteria bacterium]
MLDTAERWLREPPALVLLAWARRFDLARKLTYLLALLAAAALLATYAVWSGSGPSRADSQQVLLLLIVDLVLLLALGTLLARQLAHLWSTRRSGMAGARLHARFVGLFSLIAAGPAIATAVFSAVFLSFGIDEWFNSTVRRAVNESLAVAEAYVEEHRNAMRADMLAMANDLNREATRLQGSPGLIARVVQTQAMLRSFQEATVFERSGRVLARSALSWSASIETIPIDAIEKATLGELAIFRNHADDDEVQGLIRLDRFLDAYLYVSRHVEARVINHVQSARAAAAEYAALDRARTRLQLTSALLFVAMALLLLLLSVWLALVFANRLVRPIGELVAATERVRTGNLSVRVEPPRGEDEIATLGLAFNRMTEQLNSQQNALVEANRLLDGRRRFTEAVLSGVSAGVLGLDGDGRIHLPNRSAAELLGTSVEALAGRPIGDVAPEILGIVAQATADMEGLGEGQVALARGGHRRQLFVRVAQQLGKEGPQGHVVTFDDVTALLAAQRAAAWADIARRIAHEIKNPLTPIQLSAERLKRKYLKDVTNDPEVFLQCTDTIIRQVADIGRMVDEFSAFARMPTPVLRQVDLVELARQTIFPMRLQHGEIGFALQSPQTRLNWRCDPRQFSQVFTNLLKNAAEAIEGRAADTGGVLPAGRVELRLLPEDDRLTIEVLDNGRGFPRELKDRLTEPYVTTRTKGTGLGLAIVRKIVEDHGGRLLLRDAIGGGACVRLEFTASTVDRQAEGEGTRVLTTGQDAHGN